ncbi:MAG: zinc ribbon domain-containing protein [Roseivirga sp.]|nr:zinc ribbon domain-containing protein [Roseivirga sp.]
MNKGSKKDIAKKVNSVDELDYFEFLENAEASADEIVLQTVKCNNCNASTTVDTSSTNNACPYCGDKLVIGNLKPESVIKPWGLIPFRLDKTEAIASYKKWIRKRWFTPSLFSEVKNFQGVYIPYWTFDTSANIQFIGERGDEYSDGERVYMLWTDVIDEVQWYFDDVLICASDAVNESAINELRPWGTESLVPFEDEYLKGHISQKYEIDLKMGFHKAQDKITDGIEALLRGHIGGDDQKILKARTSYTDITFKHILLPVYIIAHDFKGKPYQIIINGKTGKVEGKVPKSLAKIGVVLASVLTLVSLSLWFLI